MTIVNLINLVGLVLGFLGSLIITKQQFLTNEEAIDIGTTRISGDTEQENIKLPLPQLLIKSSNSAKTGFKLICFGFAFQLLSALITFFFQ